jgi:hypothetical protein
MRECGMCVQGDFASVKCGLPPKPYAPFFKSEIERFSINRLQPVHIGVLVVLTVELAIKSVRNAPIVGDTGSRSIVEDRDGEYRFEVGMHDLSG